MSYDVMVFEKSAAPKKREELIGWANELADQAGGHSHDDPAVTTDALRGWYLDMIKTFPPISGPYAPDSEAPEDLDDDLITEYGIGESAICVSFVWAYCDEGYEIAREFAQKHKVGFFDVSRQDGELLR